MIYITPLTIKYLWQQEQPFEKKKFLLKENNGIEIELGEVQETNESTQ